MPSRPSMRASADSGTSRSASSTPRSACWRPWPRWGGAAIPRTATERSPGSFRRRSVAASWGRSRSGSPGYALWRFMQAIRDTEGKGTELKGIWVRLVYAFIGIVYGGLALLGVPSGSRPGRNRRWRRRRDGPGLDGLAARATVWPVACGGGWAGGPGHQRRSVLPGLHRELLRPAPPRGDGRLQERLVELAARIGYSARGVSFGSSGAAARRGHAGSPGRLARGLGGALATLAQQPFGPWLLGVVAAGLVAYGVVQDRRGPLPPLRVPLAAGRCRRQVTPTPTHQR